MPEYKYTARNAAGQKIKGTVIAVDSTDLANKLDLRKEFLLDYKEKIDAGASHSGFSFGSSVNKKVVAQFMAEMQLFIDAGIVITQALENVGRTTKDGNMKRVISSLRQSLESGETVADAMSNHPKVFDFLSVESIRVGELSGNLGKVLLGQSKRLEAEAKMSAKIKGQSIYPTVMIIIVVTLLIVMNTLVVPSLMDSYKDFLPRTGLPPKTKVIVAINQWLMDYGMFMVAGLVGFIFTWFISERFSRTKMMKDYLKMKTPVIKHAILFANLGRLSDGLRMGVDSGLGITTTLSFLERNINNSIIRKKVRAIRADVQTGATLAVAVARNELHNIFSSMINAGESTGTIPTVMEKASEYYTLKFDGLLQTVFGLVSVLIVLFLGVVVGFVMASIMIPMYELPTVL